MTIPRFIGMLHAPPLPGSPGWGGSWKEVEAHVLRDAQALVEGGAGGMMLENYGDVPFYPDRVEPVTVAAMTRLACRVHGQFPLPLGINVLRNDASAALAVALGSGATMIRVNVLAGSRVTDQGILSGRAHQWLRERSVWRGESIQILADVDVKHSAPLAHRPLEEEAIELLERCGADALLLTGTGTGKAADLEHARRLRAVLPDATLVAASGMDAANLGPWLPFVDAFLLGTSLKESGRIGQPVDEARVRAVAKLLESV